MDFPVFINKWIIGYKPIYYTPFWYWYRLMIHDDYRLDDRHLCVDFWYQLNYGYWTMEYDAFMKNTNESDMFVSSPPDMPDTIYLTEEDFDSMMDRIENPEPPTPFMRQLLSRPAPWDKQ
jgi:hypothetical protein